MLFVSHCCVSHDLAKSQVSDYRTIGPLVVVVVVVVLQLLQKCTYFFSFLETCKWTDRHNSNPVNSASIIECRLRL